MKKVLLPLIAAAAVSFGASAQTMPVNVFNYQGVCAEKGAQIEVGFDVVAENGDVVYSQKGYETTNANGAFTTTIGGHDGWDAIDWAAGKYKVVTYVKGEKVSTADLNAVPYALVAESVVGLDNIYNDINDLVMANRMNATDIAEIKELNLPNVVDNLEMLVPQIETLHEATAKNADDIAVLFDELEGKAKQVELVATQTKVAEVEEAVEANTANIASLQDAIDQVSYFINGDDSEFASVSSLATQNSKNIADIQATLDEVAYMLTEEDGEFAQISSLATQNSKNITDLQAVTEKNADDIAVAFEELDGKAKQVEMVAVQNEVSNLTNQLDMHMEVIQALIEAVAELGVEIDLGPLVEPLK